MTTVDGNKAAGVIGAEVAQVGPVTQTLTALLDMCDSLEAERDSLAARVAALEAALEEALSRVAALHAENEQSYSNWRRAELELDAVRLTVGVLAEVAAERRRQIEKEGYTAQHDDEHNPIEFAKASAAYAIGAGGFWPWEIASFKPLGFRYNLVRAAALLVAGLERLDRMHGKDTCAATDNKGNLA